MFTVLLILSLILIGGTILYGLIQVVNGTLESKKFKRLLKINIGTIFPVIIGFIVCTIPGIVNATDVAAAGEAVQSSAEGLKYIGAALSTGLACIGAGYAVGAVGASSIGAISEDPKLMAKTLIYIGLAEGIALYGMIITFMILLIA